MSTQTTANLRTAADLRAAADLLRREGWIKGDFRNKDGRCLAGAINDVCRPQMGASRRAYQALEDVIDTDFYGDWNDSPSRTLDEVLDALELAAQLAEAPK